MKTCFTLLLAFATLALTGLGAPVPLPIQRERIQAAHLLGLGRPATDAEIAAADGSATLAGLVDGLHATLRADRDLAAATARRASRDALGIDPDAHALADTSTTALTYTALVKVHLQRLAADPVAYRAVIDRAYQRVVQRTAYDIEVEYWMRRDTLSFVLLVGCIENWAQRNAPGLMSTTGTPSISIHSTYISTLRLSPAVAQEARTLIGINRSAAQAAHAAEVGYTLVAPGAQTVVGLGGIHFVAVGRSLGDPAPAGAH